MTRHIRTGNGPRQSMSRPSLWFQGIAAAAFALLAVTTSACAAAAEFFDNDDKQIIAAAFEHFQDEIRHSGMLGVQADIEDCYNTSYKKGLREKLLFCIALDSQARIMDIGHVADFPSARRLPYFGDDTYDTRVRKHLADSGISNPYDQTEVIDHIKAQLNVAAGQWVRRRVGNLSPEEQDAIIKEGHALGDTLSPEAPGQQLGQDILQHQQSVR
jgi:hypothetical protein